MTIWNYISLFSPPFLHIKHVPCKHLVFPRHFNNLAFKTVSSILFNQTLQGWNHRERKKRRDACHDRAIDIRITDHGSLLNIGIVKVDVKAARVNRHSREYRSANSKDAAGIASFA